MIFLVIGIIICLVAAIKEFWVNFCDWFVAIAGTFLVGGLGGLFLGLFLTLIFGGIIGACLPQVEVKETKELYALENNSDIYGSFFLGSGSIGEEKYYSYIVKEDKGKQIKTLEVDGNNIYLNDNAEKPTLDIYTMEFKQEWMNWIGIPSEGVEYVFNIPPNSIDYEYQIDLE